jgi:hopanoid biosynthesis associated protein HpnK
VRRLIVNADDFGLTPGVNRAILEAHASGIVTSATLMASGRTFSQAVQSAPGAPRMSVGCHVVLVDGTPVLEASQVRSLLDNEHARQFPPSLARLAWRCQSRRMSAIEIEGEVAAQIRKLQAAGISVSHLDTHKHTHMFPQVLGPVLRAARTCGVKAVRNPLEPIPLGQVAGRPSLWKRWAQVKALNRLAGDFKGKVRDAGMVTPDGTLGIVATGVMSEPLLMLMIQHIPEGTWELVCHPGYDDADLAQAGTRLRASRVVELELLKSPAIRRELEKHEIELISYHDLH